MSGLTRKLNRRSLISRRAAKKNTRGRPKGPARMPSVHDENHAVRYTHMPTALFNEIEEMPEAKVSCKHCFGTGSPGTGRLGETHGQLTCACVVRKVTELGLLEKKDESGDAKQDEEPTSD